MTAGGLTGAGSSSNAGAAAASSSSKPDKSSKASFSQADRQAKANGKKSESKPEQQTANGQNGHTSSVQEQGQKAQDFDNVQGRPDVGDRRQSSGQQGDQREGSFVDCAAGAAKDVVVDTAKGAYQTIKDAGGAVLDQAGFEGYEGHTERTLYRGKAVVDGAKRTGEAVMSPIETSKKVYQAGKAEVAEIQSEIEHGDSCALGERVGTTVGVGATAVVPGGALVKGSKVLAKMGGKDGADRSTPLPADVAKRYDDLKSQGHGPQRHGADVTTQQLEDRVLKGHDPMKGSSTDGVTGKTHRQPPTATRIKTTEDFVSAENNIRSSEQYRDGRDAALSDGKQTFEVTVPLKDTLGEQYLDKVEGRTRVGPKKPPHSVVSTDLTDGQMRAVYKLEAGSEPNLITMYPVPKK